MYLRKILIKENYLCFLNKMHYGVIRKLFRDDLYKEASFRNSIQKIKKIAEGTNIWV